MLCFGKKTPKDLEEKKSNDVIDKQLKSEGKEIRKNVKILLLGTGDCGKSTFSKQLLLLYSTPEDNERYAKNYVAILRDNALVGAQSLIENIHSWDLKMSPELSEPMEAILNHKVELTEEIAKHIQTLSKNPIIQQILKTRGDEMTLQGGASGVTHYLENAVRYASPDCIPHADDVLKARRKTTGVLETNFQIDGQPFTLVDVGGQRSERKKWLNCFSAITGVIFLCAINEYDMKLEEDENTNRLIESLKLWKALTSTDFFKPIPFMLFLNKSDLFKEKIERVPLRTVFPEFEKYIERQEIQNKTPFEQASFIFTFLTSLGCAFFEKQYKSQFGGTKFVTHITCVIDSESCRNVWNIVRANLINHTDVL